MTGNTTRLRRSVLSIAAGVASYFVLGVAAASAAGVVTTGSVAATDPLIRYTGRFDVRDAAGPRCAWPASEVELAFQGSTLDVDLNDTGHDEYAVVVDGGAPTTLVLNQGDGHYNLFTAATSGKHTVTLVKRTETFVGTTQFKDFSISGGGKLVALPRPRKHKIEIVGDSISCGYGNEGADRNQHFAVETENAYLAYGAVTARALDADYVCIAWSGKKMWPNNTMPSIYGFAVATDPMSDWDFSQWTPDVVVITLATNDFGPGIPDQNGWVTGYEAFLGRIHKNYPKAAVYCATSPMMAGDAQATLKKYLAQIISDQKAAGYNNVRVVEFETQQEKDGYGSDWHPNVKTHQIMADKLTAALEADLGWKPVSTGR